MLLIDTTTLKKGKVAAALLLSAGLLGFSAGTAAALNTRDAQAVVTVLEKLAAETGGSVYYDEDAAQEWFEIDDESSQLIPAAGFTQSSWKEAFDQTMTGFIATIPQVELEQMINVFMEKIGELGKMTPQQKQEAAEALHAEMGKFDAIREAGARYQDIVSPYAQRLRKISLQK